MLIRRTGTTGVRRAAAALWLPIFGMVAADTASAHEVRFIASYGSNASPCTRAAPCQKLQRGINATPQGGELIVLDSGDFGDAITIGRSITISAIGVSATLGGGIAIDATDATVVLRGLRLNGGGSDANGIDIATGATVDVSIEDCEIQGFHDGIRVNTSAYPVLTVAGSAAFNNSNTGLYFSTGSPGRLVVDNSRFEDNGIGGGVVVRAAEATISRSIVSGNGSDGIAVTFGGKANVTWTTAEHNVGAGYRSSGELTLEQSISRGNAVGVSVTNFGSARISNATVTNNGTDLSVANGSTLLTRGNNTIGDGGFGATLTPLDGI